MKFSSAAALCVSLCGSVASLSAAGFVDNFDPSTYGPAGTDINGVNGWSVDVLGDSGGYIAFTADIEGNPSAAIGGFDDIPAGGGEIATVSKAATLALANSYLGLTMAIEPSIDANPSFPGRDIFSFGVTGVGGSNLFTINLIPANAGTFKRYQVMYTAGAGIMSPALDTSAQPMFIDEGGTYDVSIMATPSGANMLFDVEFDGFNDVIFSTLGAGLASAQIEEFGVTWEIDSPTSAGGSNYIAFDSVTIVPEPSVAVLGLLSGMALLRRRRR